MLITILQPSYLPYAGVFDLIKRVDVFVFYDDVQYTKNDWRNRNKIKTPKGECWMTVPCHAKKQNINRTLIADNRWIDKHLKTLKMNYARAPHFEEVYTVVERQLKRDWCILSFLCEHLIRDVVDYLDIGCKFVRSSDVGFSEFSSTDRLVKICDELGADEYLSTNGAKPYLQTDKFNCKVTWQDYEHPTYPQLWGDFISHLSIVDMLFNCGKESVI